MKFTLEELADLTNSDLFGDPKHCISNIADLASAGPEDASFFSNPRYEKAMRLSRAGVIFVSKKDFFLEGKNFLLAKDPSRAFQLILEKFSDVQGKNTAFLGIHPRAFVHETAEISEGVSIAPYAVIDEKVSIASGTVIGAGSYIGAGVSIGENCHIYSNVTLRERCIVGNRVILQPGAVIGSCGFGYTNDEKGSYKKLEQIGIVVLEDDVEIGANSTVDRARFQDTRISRGSKIDNLVQIGHGVKIGRDNCIVSQSGVAGSSKTGDRVVLAAQSGVTGHVSVGSDVMLGARGGLTKSFPKPGKYAGMPAMPLGEHAKKQVFLRNIDKYVKRIEVLEKRLEDLEKER